MRNLTRSIVFAILASLIICSCKTKEAKKTTSTGKEVILDSTVVLKPITIVDNKDSLSRIVRLLNITPIDSNTMGTEIRMWFEFALSDSGRLVIIKRVNQEWNATVYSYKYNFDNNAKIISIKSKFVRKEPFSGWKDFLIKLENFKIYNLKNYNKIPKYSICADGDFMFIEIWKDKLYSRYDYPCFTMYFQEVTLTEMNDVKDICLLIQEELDFNLMKRPE